MHWRNTTTNQLRVSMLRPRDGIIYTYLRVVRKLVSVKSRIYQANMDQNNTIYLLHDM